MGRPSGPYAILMAGQLTERAGMGSPLRDLPLFRPVTDSFNGLTSGRFERWVTEAPQGEISEKFTAPSIMVLYDLLCGRLAAHLWGPPAAVAGYSLGYYSAAALSGCTGPREILEWLARVNGCNRGDFGGGGFKIAAVTGLSGPQLLSHLGEWGLGAVRIADINNARQLVLAGPAPEITMALERLKGVALDAREVSLDIPLHTPYMEAARKEVEAWWASVPATAPQIPLLSPVDGHLVTGPEDFKSDMLSSLVSPTNWLAVISRLKDMGIARALDVSPAGELGRMAKWTWREMEILPVSSLWEPAG